MTFTRRLLYIPEDFTTNANAIKVVTREERKVTVDFTLYGRIAMDSRRPGLEEDLHHTRSPSHRGHTTYKKSAARNTYTLHVAVGR